MIGAEWLRAKFNGNSSGAEPSTNALLSEIAKNSEQVLALRVNDLLEGKNDHFVEAHRSLVEQALNAAREKVQSAELAKCAAEAELDRVKSEVEIKVRQFEEQMKRTTFQLAAAEQRATAADQRANNAEASFRRLQAEILAKTSWKSLVPRAA